MSATAATHPVVVISQLPPPVHGSTLMTQVFLSALESQRMRTLLVDRRFSTDIKDVGRFSPRKVFAAIGLCIRLTSSVIRERPSAAVLFATTRTFSFLVDFVLSEILRLLRVPVVLYNHTVGFSDLAQRGHVWSLIVRRFLRGPRVIVVLDDSLAWDIRSLCETPVESIQNTLPEAPVQSSEATPVSSRRTVLFLSNLIAGKGHEDFLRLAISALEKGVDAEFVLAGQSDPATEASVQEQILRSGHGERLCYVGAVDASQKWSLIAKSRLLVFPSYIDSVGLVVLEALACGLPVISYDVGALTKPLETFGAGKIVPSGDLAGLERAAAEILQSDELTERMSSAAEKMYASNYTFGVYASRWGMLLSNLEKQSR